MNKQDKLELLSKAANHLVLAAAAMNAIVKDDDTYLTGDAAYYNFQINQLLSCDDGEAGLMVMIEMVEKDVEDEK